MFDITIHADSWADLEMKVRELFPEKPFKGKSIFPTIVEMGAKAAPRYSPELLKKDEPKKAKGWPKGKKRGKKIKPDINQAIQQAAKQTTVYVPLAEEQIISDPVRTFDNPKDAYMAAIKNWQTRTPWHLMDGTVISDRGPNVKDFQK